MQISEQAIEQISMTVNVVYERESALYRNMRDSFNDNVCKNEPAGLQHYAAANMHIIHTLVAIIDISPLQYRHVLLL